MRSAVPVAANQGALVSCRRLARFAWTDVLAGRTWRGWSSGSDGPPKQPSRCVGCGFRNGVPSRLNCCGLCFRVVNAVSGTGQLSRLQRRLGRGGWKFAWLPSRRSVTHCVTQGGCQPLLRPMACACWQQTRPFQRELRSPDGRPPNRACGAFTNVCTMRRPRAGAWLGMCCHGTRLWALSGSTGHRHPVCPPACVVRGMRRAVGTCGGRKMKSWAPQPRCLFVCLQHQGR